MRLNLDLRELSYSERLWLWRRRRGLTQMKASGLRGVGVVTYWREERAARPVSGFVPRVMPRTGDLCALARRRSGMSLLAASRGIGVSHPTLLKREKIGDPRLCLFWENKGFLFPQ